MTESRPHPDTREPSHKASLLRLCVLCLLPGCASVTVEKDAWVQAATKAPSRIYVERFEAPEAALRVDRKGDDMEAFREGLRNDFATRLVERLSKSVAPATLRPDAGKLEPGAWLVSGEFLRVNQGSRALRSLIGFGAGGTKMQTRTRIVEVRRRGSPVPVAEIVTSGGSNAEPGALFSGPFGAGPRLVLQASLTGLSADSRRTTRQIVAAISEHLALAGQPLAGPPKKAKRPPKKTERPPTTAEETPAR